MKVKSRESIAPRCRWVLPSVLELSWRASSPSGHCAYFTGIHWNLVVSVDDGADLSDLPTTWGPEKVC